MVHKATTVLVTFTNPLSEVVTDCVLRAEGSGLLKEQLNIKYVNGVRWITHSLWWGIQNTSELFLKDSANPMTSVCTKIGQNIMLALSISSWNILPLYRQTLNYRMLGEWRESMLLMTACNLECCSLWVKIQTFLPSYPWRIRGNALFSHCLWLLV